MRIAIIQGHPDNTQPHFCHAVAEAYSAGACDAGYRPQTIDVAALNLPPLRSAEEWTSPPNETIQHIQAVITNAQHVVIIYPLWLGSMPALLKAFFEQVARPGFALPAEPGVKPFQTKMLSGRSAHVFVTMGMPAAAYRLFYRAHSLKSFERNILKFVGFCPVRDTIIGSIESMSKRDRKDWLKTIRDMGRGWR